MKKKKSNILLNLAIAADMTIGAVLATFPYWYTRLPSTTVFYCSLGGCATIFAVLVFGKRVVHLISSNRHRTKIKYFHGRYYDGLKLGYISAETICAACADFYNKKTRRTKKE